MIHNGSFKAYCYMYYKVATNLYVPHLETVLLLKDQHCLQQGLQHLPIKRTHVIMKKVFMLFKLPELIWTQNLSRRRTFRVQPHWTARINTAQHALSGVLMVLYMKDMFSMDTLKDVFHVIKCLFFLILPILL